MRPRPGAGKEERDRALSYLAEGRLVVAYLDGAYVSAVCRLDDRVLNLGFETGEGWWCSCGGDDCAHVAALKLVTEPAVTLFSTNVVPSGPGRVRAASSVEVLADSADRTPRQVAEPVGAGSAEPADDALEHPACEPRLAEALPVAVASARATAEDFATIPASATNGSATAAHDVRGERSGDASVLVKARPGGPGDPLARTFVATARGARRRALVPMALFVVALAAIAVPILTAQPFRTSAARPSATATPRRPAAPRAPATPKPPPTPKPAPSPPPSAGPPTLPAVAVFPKPVSAFGLAIRVRTLPWRDGDCVTHLFRAAAAYQADCRSWNRVPGAVWFWVGVRNSRGSAFAFDLRSFVLHGAHGRVTRPVDVRSIAADPQDFLPSRAIIGPGRSVGGRLTFRPRAEWTPTSLVYRVRAGLEVDFRGLRTARGRG